MQYTHKLSLALPSLGSRVGSSDLLANCAPESESDYALASSSSTPQHARESSSESLSSEPPTIRALGARKTEDSKDDEILQLIAAGEAISQERLHQSSLSHRTSSSNRTLPQLSNHHQSLVSSVIEVVSEKRMGLREAEESITTPRRDGNLTPCREGITTPRDNATTPRDSVITPRRDGIMTPRRDSVMTPRTWDGRLALQPSVDSAYDSILDTSLREGIHHDSHIPGHEWRDNHMEEEEWNKASKEVKDVCNSSIKEHSELHSLSAPQVDRRQSIILQNDWFNENEPQCSEQLQHFCGELIQESLTTTSALSGLARLCNQLINVHIQPDAPTTAASLRRDTNDYVDRTVRTDDIVCKAAAQLQNLISQVHDMEWQEQHQREETNKMSMAVQALASRLNMVLTRHGMEHMTLHVSPQRRNILKIVEGTTESMPLLSTLLERKAEEVERERIEICRLDEQLQCLQDKSNDWQARCSTLQREMQIENERHWNETSTLKQLLHTLEEEVSQLQEDKATHAEAKVQLMNEYDDKLAQMRLKTTMEMRSSDAKIAELEKEVEQLRLDNNLVTSQHKQAERQLELKALQMSDQQEESNLLVGQLRSSVDQLSQKTEELQTQLSTKNTENSKLNENIATLKEQLSITKEQLDESRDYEQQLRKELNTLRSQTTEDIEALQTKVEKRETEMCDIGHKLRKREVDLLQAQTDHALERQKTQAMEAEAASLHHQISTLQDRLMSMYDARRRRNSSGDSTNSSRSQQQQQQQQQPGAESSSEYGSSQSLAVAAGGAGAREDSSTARQVQVLERQLKASHDREEQVQRLLQRRNEELEGTNQVLQGQLSEKDNELTRITGKVELLEKQLESLLGTLEANSTLSDLSKKVTSQLNGVKEDQVEELEKANDYLYERLQEVLEENNLLRHQFDQTTEQLTKQQEESKAARDAQKSLREELHKERVLSAGVQQKLSLLKVDLDSARSSLKDQRQERELRDLLYRVKHHELESAIMNVTNGNLLSSPRQLSGSTSQSLPFINSSRPQDDSLESSSGGPYHTGSLDNRSTKSSAHRDGVERQEGGQSHSLQMSGTVSESEA
ncbi:uncharacterized protein LOC143032825 isoform X2 [Oratosquilla oratoria]|uniref:uncharacterized protein LOC143032825 isoform X2 n=1 Tax=Oratosquilla oratoria TaxID=337810 RepID=UPI003F76F38F